nr:SH3 domain-containing protein [Pseudohoeflea sp. DP4N28-3]
MTASALLVSTVPSLAQGAGRGASGLPLPRFVSIKAQRVNLRVGPGRAYAVSWMYTRPGVPMEIIQEYDNWRRVRDADGTEGWIYQSLLSGTRTGVAAPWKRTADDVSLIAMHREARAGSKLIAQLEPGVILTMLECNGNWCRVEAGGANGWVAQNEIWGAYPGEAFKD